jgi:regulator of replication initiation timing
MFIKQREEKDFLYHWYKAKLSSKEIKKVLGGLEKATAKLKYLVKDILEQLAVEIKKTVDQIQSDATVIKDGVGVIQGDAAAIKEDASILKANNEDIKNRLGNVEETIKTNHAELNRVWREAANEKKIIDENLNQMLEDKRRNGKKPSPAA